MKRTALKKRYLVKIQKDRYLVPTLRVAERYWVNKSTGGYFIVSMDSDGWWHHAYNAYKRHCSMALAVKEAIEIEAEGKVQSMKDYRNIRVKERVFRV